MSRLPVLFATHGSPVNGFGDIVAFPLTGFEHASLRLRCVRWG